MPVAAMMRDLEAARARGPVPDGSLFGGAGLTPGRRVAERRPLCTRRGRVRTVRGFVIAAIALALAIAFPHAMRRWMRRFYISLATRILIFALAALSLDLILGYGGLVSFGHAAFMGIGGYTVGILFQHEAMMTPIFGLPGTRSAFVVWPLAVLLSGLFALSIGAVCLRTRGIFFIMITLAFAQMLFYLFVSLRQYGGEDGIPLWGRSTFGGLIDLESNITLYYVCLAILALAIAAALRLVRSPFFQVIRGAKDNERRMIALGYPVFRYQLVAFVLSGMLAGLAGVLLANATGLRRPGLSRLDALGRADRDGGPRRHGHGGRSGGRRRGAAAARGVHPAGARRSCARAGASTGGSCSGRCCSRSCWSRRAGCRACCRLRALGPAAAPEQSASARRPAMAEARARRPAAHRGPLQVASAAWSRPTSSISP